MVYLKCYNIIAIVIPPSSIGLLDFYFLALVTCFDYRWETISIYKDAYLTAVLASTPISLNHCKPQMVRYWFPL